MRTLSYAATRWAMIGGSVLLCGLLIAFKIYFTYYYAGGPLPPTGPAPGDDVPVIKLIAYDTNWEAIGGFLGMVVAGVTILIGIMDQTRQEHADAYMALELASVELFRWECENEETVRLFWDEGGDEPEVGAFSFRAYARQEYACQMLNLFEMALRLRQQEVVPRDVMGSWVIWMWDVSGASHFDTLWDDVRSNYVGLLRKTLDVAQALRRSVGTEGGPTEQEAATEFFAFLGGLLDCPEVSNWPIGGGKGSFAAQRGPSGRPLWYDIRDRGRSHRGAA